MSDGRVIRELRDHLVAAGLHGSFLVRDLSTGEEIGIDPDAEFPIASLVKLPLAIAVLTRISEGIIDGSTMIDIEPGQLTGDGLRGLGRFRQLEGAMARRAATRLDKEHRESLAGLLAQIDTATDDPDRYLDLDVAFHDVIMSASASPLSRAIIATLNTQAFGSGPYIGKPTIADRKKSNIGHHAIFKALLEGDGDAASRAMGEHICQSWLRRRPEQPPPSAAGKEL